MENDYHLCSVIESTLNYDKEIFSKMRWYWYRDY